MAKEKKVGKCNGETEVYSRVTGFYRPVRCWNKSKAEEYRQRQNYSMKLEDEWEARNATIPKP